jgi:hypothetical protein
MVHGLFLTIFGYCVMVGCGALGVSNIGLRFKKKKMKKKT